MLEFLKQLYIMSTSTKQLEQNKMVKLNAWQERQIIQAALVNGYSEEKVSELRMEAIAKLNEPRKEKSVSAHRLATMDFDREDGMM
jgi:hypothetical protein